MSQLIDRARRYRDSIAVVDKAGNHTYEDLVNAAISVAAALRADSSWANGARVAMMITPSFEYVAVLWGVWLAGGIAVPLALTHPDSEIQYVIDDAGASVVVASGDFANRLEQAVPSATVIGTPQLLATADRIDGPPIGCEEAMLLYTSGTTGRPKGVVWRHAAIATQVEIMTEAWGWRPDDRVLLVLPLHHVHGLINVVATALWNGACIEMENGFEAAATWNRLRSGDLTVFMAVPTIYRRLIAAWAQFSTAEQDDISSQLPAMRLMVSGSAALPVATLEEWRRISGQVLLERYGMTEIGMALSNDYRGDRIPGAVGRPLPSVEARVVDDADAPVAPGTPGHLQIRGPSVFHRYWQRPEATAASFIDGWFRTGDVVIVHDGMYRILGRASVDIIKTGGEKVSALEIEEVLRRHSAIADCAVVGIPDEEWGELVVAALTTPRDVAPPDLGELRDFCRNKLAPEKIPRRAIYVEELPRNALGKVLKPIVKEMFGA